MREAEEPAGTRRRGLALAGATFGRAFDGFFRDGCPKLAAAISFYSLFALFPVAILAVTAFGIVVDDPGARDRIIDTILQAVPLQEQSGREDLRHVLRSVTAGASVSGVLGTAGLIFAASGVIGAVRFALNHVWGAPDTRPPLRGKAFDVVLVLAAGVLLAASLGLTVLVRSVGSLHGIDGVLVGELAPAVLAFGVYFVLLRIVPTLRPRPRSRDILPGALIGALGYAAAKIGFGVYLDRISDLGAIYASLTAVIAFLLFVWISANLFLLGAEVSAVLPAMREQRTSPGDGESLGRRAGVLLRGLILRPRHRVEDAEQP